MATLILTAVGSAVAGPFGAALGAIVGQQVDARLFAPKARQGPRLGELAVQTSAYGSAIPKIFGRMRVAGTVIWATDLQERSSRSGGGKGAPTAVAYSYSASFAVALSGRRISGVGRIWADGKLLRGAAGDFKSSTRYRLYRGHEDQEADPLIAAAEGGGGTPAYRGIAYAVFEDFQLADFGNRIPSLTFEVEADAGPVSIGAIAEALSEGAVRTGDTPGLAGYAASGDSVRGAVEVLGDVVQLSLVEDGDALRITGAIGTPTTIDADDQGAHAPGSAAGRTEILRRAAASVPCEVSIAHHDPARDYQTGLQRATRPGVPNGSGSSRADRRALAAALDAATAKGFAERRLSALWVGRATAKIHLGCKLNAARPGTHLTVAGAPGLWKVARWTLDRMVVSLELVRVRAGGIPSVGATAGRPVTEPDQPHGPTTAHLLDLPLYGELATDRPQLLVAAAGAESGWRRAEMTVSYDAGASWQAAGSTAAPAVVGVAATALGPGGSALLNLKNSVEIELLNDAMWLEGRTDAALCAGANVALLGDELCQFGSAQPIGNRKFRLGRLMRGRMGTEWAATGHAAGERFVLIDRASLAVLEPPPAMLGGAARLLAAGIGDGDDAAEASATIVGAALLPPSPVHLRAETFAGGDIAFCWVRRSRAGWVWSSGSDTPLSEESEHYRVTLLGAGFERSLTVTQPAFVYTMAAQASDGFTGSMTVLVSQAGTAGESRPASLVIN